MKVLLAIDDSKFSDAAIHDVLAQPHSPDTEVRVMYAVQPPSSLVGLVMGGYVPAIDAVSNEETKHAQAFVTKTADMLRSSHMRVTTAVQQGTLKSMITDVSEA